jgi:membrane protein required for beta-lactamase induction
MSRRKEFVGVKPEEEKTWYLQALLVLSILAFFFGVAGALYGLWFGFLLLVLGLIVGVASFRELLDRSGS